MQAYTDISQLVWMQIEMIILHEFLFSFQSYSPLIQGQMYTGIVFLYHRDRDKFHLCMDQQQMSIPDLQAEHRIVICAWAKFNPSSISLA